MQSSPNTTLLAPGLQLDKEISHQWRKHADNCGHHKTDDEVDELERLRRDNLRLKHELKEQGMVVELLKKAKEFERE